MNERFDLAVPDNSTKGQQPVPDLSPPPRTVPAVIQWQMLQYRVVLIIGGAFVLFSLLVFIVPQWAAGNRFESSWQFFPFLHLTVGLGMIIVPLVAWRKRVAVLRLGRLAPARLVAIQDQGMIRAPGEESYGVRNVAGPWLDYERAFTRAKRFWANKLPVMQGGSPNLASFVLTGFGCLAMAMGLFTILFMVVVLTLTWLSDNPLPVKGTWTLFCLGFLAVYLATVWLIYHWAGKVRRIASGELALGKSGVPSTVRCRFVFVDPTGREREATANLDLRARLRTGQANPHDLVVYLPDDPNRNLLLGGVWPPLAVQHGQLVQQPQVGA